MKKVLLATTILGMSAGFAAAEIAFTGEAAAGFAHENGNDYESYTSLELSVAATAESDSGLSFGASFSLTAGKTFDFDGDGSSFEDYEDSDFGAPSVFVSGDFGKVEFAVDGYADYSNDDDDFHDIEYTHSIGDFSIGLRADVDNDDEDSEDAGEYSVQLGYAVSGIEVGLNYDSLNETYDVSASYETGALTFGLGHNDAEVTTVSVDYSANGISAGIEANSDDEYTLSAGYEADGLSVGASTDQDSIWEVTAGYDLGGGLELEAGFHESESAFVGAKMAF